MEAALTFFVSEKKLARNLSSETLANRSTAISMNNNGFLTKNAAQRSLEHIA